MKNKLLFLLLVASCSLGSCFLPAMCEDPVKLDAQTDDISLTDNVEIAKAQVSKYPENPEAHFNLAIALSQTSLVEESIKELRRTKKLIRKPENAGVIDKKIQEYSEMLKHDSNAHNIRYRLAFSHYLKAYFYAKEAEKAEGATGKAEESKTKNGLNLFGSNKLSINSNDPNIKEHLSLSIKYFNELIGKDPTNIWAKVYLGFILAEQLNDFNKAKDLWMTALDQDPSNPAPHFFLGELHIKEGNLKEGIAEIANALLLRAQGH